MARLPTHEEAVLEEKQREMSGWLRIYGFSGWEGQFREVLFIDTLDELRVECGTREDVVQLLSDGVIMHTGGMLYECVCVEK